ncbi:uncharacterized protein LOC134771704 isoform X2 [Penaeus indicus]|uniref:uncharacterized protein LOC134771704 isoform X2 n=1 Tax=Penaeus indicus TaxID=29960 RepID=UPI00300DB112
MSLATHKMNERLQRERGEERECRLVWTINMEEMLIYFVRGNRMLWDPSHPSFPKLAMKKRRVEDIAALLRREVGPEEAFAVTAENVWKKFRSMRIFFLREVKKVHDSRSNIGDEGYTSTWAHYNRMRFLLQSLRPKENQESDHPRHISLLGSQSTVHNNNSEVRASSPMANNSPTRYEAPPTRQPNGVSDGLAKYEAPSASQPRVASNEGRITPHSTTPRVSASSNSVSRSDIHYQGTHRKRQRTAMPTSDALEKVVESLQNIRRDCSDVAGTFGNFVAASLRGLPEDKQHDVMSSITRVLSDSHKN